MNDTLAIMFTFTTFGTWLRGDERGWTEVSDKRICFNDAFEANR